MSKITGTVTNGVTLGQAGFTSPLKITAGGYVSNSTGTGAAVYASGSYANPVVVNHGTIMGSGSVELNAGGSVRNTGLIQGEGIAINGGAGGTVKNSGTITATGPTSHDGVSFGNGGRVTNSGLIQGHNGVAIWGAAGTVVNSGTIMQHAGAGWAGVNFGAGGRVTNTGLIQASREGVHISGAAGTVTNSGTIAGTVNGVGVSLVAGGAVINSGTGLIQGYRHGVYVTGAAGTVTNSATIAGTGGVDLRAGGSINNAAGGIITGSTGVYVPPAATPAVTLTNAGTIAGTGGTAVKLGAGNDKVIVQPGAVFNGAVLGGTGTDALVFKTVGAISLSGFAGFETIRLSSAGANTLALANANFAEVTSASITVAGGGAADTVDASLVSGPNRLVFTGGDGADIVTAGGGADTLNGEAGNDTLNGGGGDDTLTGGASPDQFVFLAGGNGKDIITDFSGQTAFGSGAGQQDTFTFDDALQGTFAYRGGNAFTGSGNTEARVSNGKVQVDFNGDGATDLTISVTGLTGPNQLSVADFKFI